VKESEDRPTRVGFCHISINVTRTIMENITQRQEVTEDEKAEVLRLCNQTEDWIEAQLFLQSQLQPHEDPILTSAQVDAKCEPLHWKLKSLTKRPHKKPPKPKVNETITVENEKNSTGENTTEEETSSTEGTTTKEQKGDQDNKETEHEKEQPKSGDSQSRSENPEKNGSRDEL